MMILVLLKNAFYAHHATPQGRWIKRELGIEQVLEFRGKTLGILGLGAIGTEVAKRARAFGPRIIYNKRNRLTKAEEEELGVARARDQRNKGYDR